MPLEFPFTFSQSQRISQALYAERRAAEKRLAEHGHQGRADSPRSSYVEAAIAYDRADIEAIDAILWIIENN